MLRIDPRAGLLFGLLFMSTLVAGCAATRELDTGTPDASAELKVPYHFQVQALDGHTLRQSFHSFDAREQRLPITPGAHTLVLRYFDLVDNVADRTDDYTRVLSEPITVEFTAQANRRYAVVGERPETPERARAFAQDPELTIERVDTGAVVSTDVQVAEPKRDVIRRGDTVYAPIETTESAAAPPPARNAAPESLQMLKYWWNNAGAEERERFEAWRESTTAP